MAICGWGYLVLVLAPWYESGVGRHLPTTYLLAYADDQFGVDDPAVHLTRLYPLIGPARITPSGGGSSRLMLNSIGPTTATGPDSGLVVCTGHALFALLFGFAGGVTAKWFYVTRSPREDEHRHA
jgi:hypothetical protein